MAHPVAPAWASTRHTFVGSFRVFLAESLLIPSALLTAAYLARRLGPEGYGLFTVAAALVAWIEWSLTALFSRASVKFVADSADWRPIGAAILRIHLAASLAVALLLWLLATPLAAFLGEPAVAGYLRVFALDIPLFSLAQAHRNILIGVGKYTERALGAAARWVSRLILVVVLVELGLSVEGAIWGSIGASLVELAVVRVFVRPAFSAPATFQMRKLWGFAVPLLLSALALRFFDKLDLITLTALGGTAEQAGHYGAAQNLSILPSLVTLAFSPVLLSALSRALREGDRRFARGLSRHAMRGVVLLAPFAGLVAGSASEIVRLVFGPAFDAAAPLLSWLIFAALALVLVSVGTAILTAAGRPGLTLALTGPIPLLALSGYVILIPQLGPPGAALVTTLCATAVALGTVLAVRLVCQASPPIGSVFRSTVLGVAAYALGTMWATPGFLLLVKLPLMSLAILLAFGLLGEFSKAELRAGRALLSRQPETR